MRKYTKTEEVTIDVAALLERIGLAVAAEIAADEAEKKFWNTAPKKARYSYEYKDCRDCLSPLRFSIDNDVCANCP